MSNNKKKKRKKNNNYKNAKSTKVIKILRKKWRKIKEQIIIFQL
ncbi:hypothetical protein [Clostridioides difficile]|nr:hypothetical protein [Clostridioides difficile]